VGVSNESVRIELRLRAWDDAGQIGIFARRLRLLRLLVAALIAPLHLRTLPVLTIPGLLTLAERFGHPGTLAAPRAGA
jgi:hypothetical protein